MKRPNKEDHNKKNFWIVGYASALEKYIDHLESKSEWIIVEDRLPNEEDIKKNDGRFMVYSYHKYEINGLIKEKWGVHEDSFDQILKNQFNTNYTTHKFILEGKALMWQELPSPPNQTK